MNKISCSRLLALGLFSTLALFNPKAAIAGGLSLQAPEIRLPNLNLPLGEREAKISPQEYPLAQELKPLLVQENYEQALTLLLQHQPQKSPALLLLMAQIYTQKQQYKLAEKYYQQGLVMMPDLVRAHLGLANIYQLQQSNLQARASLTRAISLGASQPLVYSQLAYLNMQLGEINGAIAAYQYALMLAPDDVQNTRGLLVAFTMGKQFAAAQQLLEQLLEQQADDAQLWLHRAFIAMEMEHKQQALSSAEIAIRLGYKGKEARQLASQLHLKQGNISRAIVLSKDLYLRGELKFSEMDKLVHYLKRTEQWSYIQDLLSAMARNKNSMSHDELSRFYLFQGYYSQHQQQLVKAKTWFKQAVETDGTHGQALLALAKAVVKDGHISHADLLYQRAERLEGTKLQAMLARAQLYIDTQDHQAALVVLQQAHRQFPKVANITRNIQSLKNLLNNRLSS